MYRSVKYISLFLVSAALLVCCKKNNLVIDQNVVPPAFAKFNTLKAADTVGTYYVKSTNDPYKLPIGVTNVSDKDRVVQLTYTSSSAMQGTQYNAPASITIPASKALDTLVVQGLFTGYTSSSRKDTVIITITGGDVKASGYKNTFRLILRKYCDVILSDLNGDYNAIDNGNYGPYPIAISTPASTGTTTGSLIVSNLWDPGIPVSVKVNLDWADPAKFTVTIPDQAYSAPDDLWIKGTSAGTFSSCDQTFTFRYTLYYKSTGANYYANQVTVLNR